MGRSGPDEPGDREGEQDAPDLPQREAHGYFPSTPASSIPLGRTFRQEMSGFLVGGGYPQAVDNYTVVIVVPPWEARSRGTLACAGSGPFGRVVDRSGRRAFGSFRA